MRYLGLLVYMISFVVYEGGMGDVRCVDIGLGVVGG